MIRHLAPMQSRLSILRHIHALSLLAVITHLASFCAHADEASWDELLEPPVAVAGQWNLISTGNRAISLALQVTQRHGRIEGRASDGRTLSGTVDGHRVRFTLHCPQEESPDCLATRHDGRLDGAYIRGQGDMGSFSVHLKRDFALTFDDGPLPGATDQVLKALADLRTPAGTPVRAGFFFVATAPADIGGRLGNYAPFELWRDKGSLHEHPELVRHVLHAGHYIGNHGAHHAWSWWPWQSTEEDLREEILQWEHVAQESGLSAFRRIFRPPYLARIDAATEVAAQLGYNTIGGLTTGDAEPLATLESVQQRALHALEYCAESPCPLIFHDTRPVPQQHLAQVVEFLQQRGFSLVDFVPPSQNIAQH